MNALVDASNLHLAAAPIGDRFAARLAWLAARLPSRGPVARKSLAEAAAMRDVHLVRSDLVVLQESAEAAADVVEPSTDELLERLAALRENIRRARQRYLDGARGLDQSAAEKSASKGERGRA